ncbi:MAG: hypothetical protein ACXWZ2_07840 [Mycobacterium sp.]
MTGTSRGFGREWAIAALERGDKVAGTARNTATLDDLAAKFGDAQLPIQLDVTDKIRELIGGYIETLNEQLNRWEQIKRFAILDRELSIAAGDLTPSLKAKRSVIVKNFADTIAALYD